MNEGKFKRYIIDTIKLLKAQAMKAKKDADNPKEGFKDYAEGVIMGYYSIISLLKHQAFVFCIDQRELGLADITPDINLLGLHKNPDTNFVEDNWSIDVMTEEKVKGYLSDLNVLLKEQAMEAKKDASAPKEGFESYNKGELMAYHRVFSTMKKQASLFDIKQEEIHLSDIDPDRDLVV